MSKKSFNKVFIELTPAGSGNFPFKRIYSTKEIIQKTLQSMSPSSSFSHINKKMKANSISNNFSIKRKISFLNDKLKSKSVQQEGHSNRPIVNINKSQLDFSSNKCLCQYTSKRIMITSNIVRKYAKTIHTKKEKTNSMRQLLLSSDEKKKTNSFESYIKELTENAAGLKLLRSGCY